MKTIDHAQLASTSGGQVAQIAERVGLRTGLKFLGRTALKGANAYDKLDQLTGPFGINREWAEGMGKELEKAGTHLKGSD